MFEVADGLVGVFYLVLYLIFNYVIVHKNHFLVFVDFYVSRCLSCWCFLMTSHDCDFACEVFQ